MRGKIVKALTAVAVAAVAAYFMPKQAKRDTALPIPVGESISFLPERTGANMDPIRLYYYRPLRWTEKDPVLVGYHGFGRDASAFCKELQPLADEKNIIIVCPEFSKKKYPGARWYQDGNMSDSDEPGGNIQPKESWTFPAADRIMEEVRTRSQTQGKLIAFGHSAGAQFLHKKSLFDGEEKADVVAIANSGWFTMPDRKIAYPYGIEDIGITDEELAKAFARPVILFMGGNDVERKPPFRMTPEADAQGLNRKERCMNYFSQCREKAEDLQVPFNWKLETVEGVAHEDGPMARGAVEYILGN